MKSGKRLGAAPKLQGAPADVIDNRDVKRRLQSCITLSLVIKLERDISQVEPP
jgi:hypothetical protein